MNLSSKKSNNHIGGPSRKLITHMPRSNPRMPRMYLVLIILLLVKSTELLPSSSSAEIKIFTRCQLLASGQEAPPTSLFDVIRGRVILLRAKSVVDNQHSTGHYWPLLTVATTTTTHTVHALRHKMINPPAPHMSNQGWPTIFCGPQ